MPCAAVRGALAWRRCGQQARTSGPAGFASVRPPAAVGRRCRINMTQTLTNAPVSAAAERMRRHRARRRDGLRSLTIELHEREVDALIRSGFLKKGSRNEPNAVAQALYRVFDRLFR